MRKLNLKNIVLAGLVGLFFSASVYAAPITNLDSCDLNLTDNYINTDSSGTSSSPTICNLAENTNHVEGRNAVANTAWNNPFIECQNPGVDVLPAQSWYQYVAALQAMYFLQITDPSTGVQSNSDLRRMIDYCSTVTGVTQLAGGGALWRAFLSFLAGSLPGQTPGICQVSQMADIINRIEFLHAAGTVTIPASIVNLLDLNHTNTAFGGVSCKQHFCSGPTASEPNLETPNSNSFC